MKKLLNQKKPAANNSSNTVKTKTKINNKEYDFSNLKLGMTKEKVISILGRPINQNSVTLYYGKNDSDFDNGNKLINGSPKNINEAAKKY